MKQYFHYFRFLYIALGIMAVITILASGAAWLRDRMGAGRSNTSCPEERVYDYADVLSDKEEEELRSLIAKTERATGCDIVLVTLNEALIDSDGYISDYEWEKAMTSYADDFYDQNLYGYNEVHGDGVLLLDNWYEGQGGSWLSTCGRAYDRYSHRMIDKLIDGVYDRVEKNPYKAYEYYVKTVGEQMSRTRRLGISVSPVVCLLVALIPAFLFVTTHLKSTEGVKSTVQTTYVDYEHGGAPVFTMQRDELINKYVTSCAIKSSSSSGGSGGRSSGGRAGGHRSSSGVSHGGGGRRR